VWPRDAFPRPRFFLEQTRADCRRTGPSGLKRRFPLPPPGAHLLSWSATPIRTLHARALARLARASRCPKIFVWNLTRRPGLSASQPVHEDFARLIRLSEDQGWRLIVTEMGIDTRTPMGKAMAHMAVVFTELERDFSRTRTREALQVKKENGVTLGRPRSTPEMWWRCAGAHGGQDRVRHCPRFEQGRCADCASHRRKRV